MLKQTVSSLEELKLRERIEESERFAGPARSRSCAPSRSRSTTSKRRVTQYDLLAQICHSLEELADARCIAPVLAPRAPSREAERAPRSMCARRRLPSTPKEIERIEAARDDVNKRIKEQNLQSLDCLHYDLRDALSSVRRAARPSGSSNATTSPYPSVHRSCRGRAAPRRTCGSARRNILVALAY